MNSFMFFNYTGDPRVINKNVGGTIFRADVHIPRGEDFRNMEIIISGNTPNINSVNYAVDASNDARYYYIDRIEVVGYQVYKYYLRFDALMTYGANILPDMDMRYYRAVRSGDKYDGALDMNIDRTFKTYNSNKTLVPKVTRVLTTIGGDKSH